MTRSERRRFRFGVAGSSFDSFTGLASRARQVESLGFSTLLVPDLIGAAPAPLTTLAVAASATSTLGIGTWVLNNELRHPAVVAHEAATLDLLSDNRFELGIGPGNPAANYTAAGVPIRSGKTRTQRLSASVAIIDSLLRGRRVSVDDGHYNVQDFALSPPPRQKPPLLVAAGGTRTIQIAARYADTVVFSVFTADALTAARQKLLTAAGSRYSSIELALRCHLTRQRGAVNTVAGSTSAIAAQLRELRDRHDVSYVVVGDADADALAPVVAELAGS